MIRNIPIAAILAMVTARAPGQGMVGVQATADKIRYTTDGTTVTSVATNNPAMIPGYGTLNIALYSAPAGTVLHSLGGSPLGVPDLSGPWVIQTSPLIQNIVPLPGAIPTVNVTLDASSGAPGSEVELEAVYWTGNFSSFGQALASGSSLVAWSGSAASGGAFGWQQPSGTSVLPVIILLGAGGFNGLVTSVPEPSTLVLGGLGATALLLFRRRK